MLSCRAFPPTSPSHTASLFPLSLFSPFFSHTQNLYLQFNKKANLYFLFIAILSLFPLSPKAWWVSVLPLVFVLAVSALKEAVEDWGRHRQDQKINSSLVLAWRAGAFVPVEWREVIVGDVLKIVENGAFPADMALLQARRGCERATKMATKNREHFDHDSLVTCTTNLFWVENQRYFVRV